MCHRNVGFFYRKIFIKSHMYKPIERYDDADNRENKGKALHIR